MKRTLIKGGAVVSTEGVFKADVLISGDQILTLGQDPGLRPDAEIDARGLLVLPGAVDSHVHFNDRFMGATSRHDYYTGTLAAAFGGVTSVIDFSNQTPGESLLSTIENKQREASGLALVDYGVHPVITQPTEETIGEIPLAVEKGAPTIKCYTTYRAEGLLMEQRDLERIAKALAQAGGMLMVHAEDDEIITEGAARMLNAGHVGPIYHAKSRPIEAENRAIERCVEIAGKTGGSVFIVHLASADGLGMIVAAREQGVRVFCETCTHYLLLTDEMLERDDGIKWICSPPLRDQENLNRLWRGLAEGEISMVTSDDAAFSWEAKLLGKERFDLCPNGIPGVEPRVNLLYSEGVAKGRLDLPKLVEITSAAPARLFGLAPKKGSLEPGADADIVLFDPDEEWTMSADSLHMAVDWCAYEGIRVKGKIKKVFSRGELVIDGQRCLAEKGRGRYLYRRLDWSKIGGRD